MGRYHNHKKRSAHNGGSSSGSGKNHGQHHRNADKGRHRQGGDPQKPKRKEGPLVGLVITGPGADHQLIPSDKKDRTTYRVAAENLGGATPGDIVTADRAPEKGMPGARVTKVVGRMTDPGMITKVSYLEQGLCAEFTKAALDETQGLTVPELGDREDLRHIPLVTIDGADARDFDDAVFAEETPDGFHLIVAIADVAWYVRPGSSLDKDAYQRGNSTYFADRVLPMLPEALSNGLCSLKPNEDRACLAVHMHFDRQGNLTSYKPVRGLMCSAARLTYEQVQEAHDGKPDAVTSPLMNTVIKPLYAAYDVLKAAREKRGALNLEKPEYRAVVDPQGVVTGINCRGRMDSHMLIEEYMVNANVTVAVALEDAKEACMYRVHSRPPSKDSVDQLRRYLKKFHLSLPDQINAPGDFKDVLEQAGSQPYGQLIHDAVLRVQARAEYSMKNDGHFGLARDRYAHFTSPIRRYPDLEVHRLLINAYGLGEGGLPASEYERLPEVALRTSTCERASAFAEWMSHDRFAASFLAASKGTEMQGLIKSATNSGLFIELPGVGAQGLLPVSRLPQDKYRLDEEGRLLKGERKGRTYCTGAFMKVRLVETDIFRGSLLLEPANTDDALVAGMRLDGGPSQKKHRRGPRR